MKKRDFNRLQDNRKKDFVMRNFIDGTDKVKPYVDYATGMVYLGTDADRHKREKE